MSAPITSVPAQPEPASQLDGRCATTYIAFVETLQEWAELPADGPDAPYWGAAMAYEMSVGVWSGCHIRILAADSVLYPVLLGTRGAASLWRDRTSDVGARARELRETSMRAYRVRARGSQPGIAKLEPDPRQDGGSGSVATGAAEGSVSSRSTG